MCLYIYSHILCDVGPVCVSIYILTSCVMLVQCVSLYIYSHILYDVGPVCVSIYILTSLCDVGPVCVSICILTSLCDVGPVCVSIYILTSLCDVGRVCVLYIYSHSSVMLVQCVSTVTELCMVTLHHVQCTS